MFSKRKEFSQHYKFDSKFINKFTSDLVESGFNSVSIKLPHNLIDDGKDEIKIEEFINRERNYPSVILVAKNESKNEIIKVLFVNISSKAFFKDNTFPSGHSEPPELYVQSPDPARTYALFGFFYDYIRSSSIFNAYLIYFLYTISYLVLITEYYLIFSNKKGLLAQSMNVNSSFDILLVIIVFIVIFKFFSYDGGLFVKDKQNRYANLLRRITKGEFKDNPIVNLLITIVGGLLVVIIAKYFGF